MREWKGKRYWLVGASEGLGRALAHEMSAAGATMVLSARTRERLEALSGTLPCPSEVLPMDVTDADSVRAAAEEAGEVDGLVWLAGVYWPMAAQQWDAEKAALMCDVNLTGAARVLGEVVPGMVRRGRGHVVLTGSLSGFRGLPGAIGYGASKAGVMSLAETMRADLKGSGVEVQLVNPGFIRTRLTEKNDFPMPFILEPDAAAKRYFAHMNTRRFAANFPRAFGAMFRLSQFLPDWLYYRIVA
ncbi:SDR family NAD(P)-dependent oxidoreductase [Ostreiculturibacter nitratireducens]|uniref:SDR family NAD(P)-dependent oxidoreductase n=1 Tax=Ostreiculturibacter nitratireducens TaxID=3075226 RepID=UPI0031B5ECD8